MLQTSGVKYGALFLLVAQNTALVILMRVSRTAEGPMYHASTAIATMEIIKFLVSLVMVGLSQGGIVLALQEEVISQPIEVTRLALPSLLYIVQNNLLFYALSHLDAATFLVGYQLKIPTTAVFSVLMLGKSLTSVQWLSLVLLTLGVVMAQYTARNNAPAHHNTTMGFVAVVAAACSSGFSGVYFERILKGSTTSLWSRNLQMSSSSVVLSLLAMQLTDGPAVQRLGFFHGYTSTVWSVVVLQALGGLVVAVVVKYADNILKVFATAFSITTASAVCYMYLGFKPSVLHSTGASLVCAAIYLYEKGAPKAEDFFDVMSSDDPVVGCAVDGPYIIAMPSTEETDYGPLLPLPLSHSPSSTLRWDIPDLDLPSRLPFGGSVGKSRGGGLGFDGTEEPEPQQSKGSATSRVGLSAHRRVGSSSSGSYSAFTDSFRRADALHSVWI